MSHVLYFILFLVCRRSFSFLSAHIEGMRVEGVKNVAAVCPWIVI